MANSEQLTAAAKLEGESGGTNGEDGMSLDFLQEQHPHQVAKPLHQALAQTVPNGGNDYWDPPRTDKVQPKSKSWWDRIIKFFKVLTIGLIFLLLLGCTMVSKSTVLLATSQLRPNPMLSCKTDIGDTNQTYCITSPVVSEGDNRTVNLYCLDKGEGMKDLAATEREVCEAVTIRWIWCLILMMCTPYIFVILRCTWHACFRERKKTSYCVVLWVCFQEVLYSVGMCLLVFKVLPNANGFTQSLGLMAGVAILPGFLRMFNRSSSRKNFLWWLVLILDCLAFGSQLMALLLIPVLTTIKPEVYDKSLEWTVPVSLLLISLPWWENYLNEDTWLFGRLVKRIGSFREDLKDSRNISYLIASFLKMITTLIMAIAVSTKEPSLAIFSFDWGGARCDGTVGPAEIAAMTWDWLRMWGINAAAGLVAYFLAGIAVKIKKQIVCYVIPLVLTTPFVYATLTGMCEIWNQDPCRYTDTIPGHLFWQCYPRGGLGSLYTEHYQGMLFVWYISLFWIGRHIFHPSSERLLTTNSIFTLPSYDSIGITEWLVFNKSRKDKDQGQVEESAGQDTQQDTNVPLVHACITMWHETGEEMQSLLNSVFKLDEYQSRSNEDVDTFRLQVNIYFDDAMEKSKDALNGYVKQLITSIREVSTQHGRVILPRKKMHTPYGGRIVWRMPHGTEIVLHLKDTKKIKGKKRWSQVMYMYELINFNNSINDGRKDRLKDDKDFQNTYLLALDGDVDFEPQAVLKLMDLMKKDKIEKDKKTAAVCGRIHPLGSGPMVWYQKFEYALGHWMQKAAEHVYGCVLCSPGCFSLFRASALRNVLPIYTAQATEAKHFIQYDQGEDRWLNTLLIQDGNNVEYCAASDSSTFVPEMLSEFFKQRRRWMPSTMANILDLLSSWKTIVKNDKISRPYILYQAMLFALSLVGGGTIFLMIVGALQVALNGAIDKWTSLVINAVPVLIYTVICIKGKPDTQALASAVLTVLYALMQALVLVGIIVQMSKDGICSPTGVFFFFVGGVFITAACLHPQEFTCVIYGIIYFLAIPSMYMLLTIYSVLNLNVMSWGTRETKGSSEEIKEGPARGLPHSNTQHGRMMSVRETCMILCCGNPDMATVDMHATEASSRTEEHATLAPEEKADGGATAAESVEQQSNEDWMEDACLQEVDASELTTREEQFYKDLIKKRLSPIKEEEKHKEEKEMSEKLETLRNIVATGYFVVNAVFVIIIFTLQANVDSVSVAWPCGQNLRLEPIGFTFLICFGFVMVLQSIGMVIHRTSTFLHIIATTPLCQSKQAVTTANEDDLNDAERRF